MRVTVRDLQMKFPGQPDLFTKLSFSLEPGSLIGIVGPSGSGKSTLLSVLAGFIHPVSGSIQSVNVQNVGWILQNPVGVPRRTALDQVVFPMLIQGISRPRAEVQAHELLKLFELDYLAAREFRHLSGGEAQRLAFARAAAANFDVLLLDEPTAQLDPKTAQTIHRVIRGLVASNRIVVLATHDQVLRQHCDTLIELGLVE